MELLKEIIETRFNGSQAEFARAIKRSPSQVHQWIKRHRKFGDGSARHVELTLNLPNGYFDQAGTARRKFSVIVSDKFRGNIEPGPNIKGKVPLISHVQAGEWSEIIDNFQPGDAEEWFPCPICHSKKTFALRVHGESMYNPHSHPSFREGDLIFVDPERSAVNGSLVVVRLEDEKEATFKKLIIEGDKKYLKALNPAWPEPMIKISSEATICGVVIFKGEIL